jgi:type II protein arginine methyltransferase
LDDVINLIPRPSWELDAEKDLGGKADLLVSEILSDTLLDEGILRTTYQARETLLKPGAQLIPYAVSAIARLVGGEALAATTMVHTVCGFDLSPFNRCIPSSISINTDSRELLTLSDDIEVFRFNLTEKPPESEQRSITCTATADGMCLGALQWLRLYLDEETIFENRPADRFSPSAWRQRLYLFAEPAEVRAGDEITFRAGHNVTSLAIDRELRRI